MSLILDSEEIHALTMRVQHAAQARVLNAMGIEHRTRPDGSIAVLRSHVEQVMGGPTTKRKKDPEINWSGINAPRTQHGKSRAA
jgi:hypothetical protein